MAGGAAWIGSEYCPIGEAITSTAGGIMPVTLVDGEPVGTGTPGAPDHLAAAAALGPPRGSPVL